MSSALWCVTNGRAAAPPAMACSVGVSTSTIALAVEVACGCVRMIFDALARHGRASPGCRSGRGSGAAAGTPCPACRAHLSGCGCSDLPRNVSFVGEDRSARRVLVLPKRAVDADQVAQVEFLRQLPARLADLLLAEHDLDPARPGRRTRSASCFSSLALGLARGRLAGPVLDVEEVDLAALAPADDAARCLDAAVRLPARRRAVRGLLDGRVSVEALAPRIEAERSILRNFSSRLLSTDYPRPGTFVRLGKVHGVYREIWILVFARSPVNCSRALRSGAA